MKKTIASIALVSVMSLASQAAHAGELPIVGGFINLKGLPPLTLGVLPLAKGLLKNGGGYIKDGKVQLPLVSDVTGNADGIVRSVVAGLGSGRTLTGLGGNLAKIIGNVNPR